ncbi:MAG: ABC transporter ATP-binding protein [Candidatus Gracilibacteria bacterium]|jgi:ABC-type nitrate/sulfonate/bicarbonate transport system ATPase subunit|nr:ABC transporter ATP-binding protein [Candidatus Gracilibacteria bacterium]
MADKILELKNVGKIYNDTFYIRNVSFLIKAKEIISLLGPSGCGKTTILKLIGGITNYEEGEVKFYNNNFKMGYVPQHTSLLPNRTVFGNISLVLEINKNSNKKTHNEKIFSILEKVGMTKYKDFLPHQLSGGMKQKVALARALVLNPKILLMDEPFSAIDEITRWNYNFDLIDLLHKENISVLFVTHNIEEAVLLSDQIFLISTKKPTHIYKKIKIIFKNQRNRELLLSKEYLKKLSQIRKTIEINY